MSSSTNCQISSNSDHMIPISELEKHRQGLINAQLLAARIFISEEHADNYCQVVNTTSALGVILAGIDKTTDL